MADHRKPGAALMNPKKAAPTHIPVMLEETLEALSIQPGGRYFDCTVGGGGHSAAILKRSTPGGQLLGIDADPDAVVAHGIQLVVAAQLSPALADREEAARVWALDESPGGEAREEFHDPDLNGPGITRGASSHADPTQGGLPRREELARHRVRRPHLG